MAATALSHDALLDVLAANEGVAVRVLVRRPGGAAPLAVMSGRVGPVKMSVDENGGLACIPLAEDGWTALNLSAAEFVAAADHGAWGLAVTFGDAELQVDWTDR